jgi:hypothetical protein
MVIMTDFFCHIPVSLSEQTQCCFSEICNATFLHISAKQPFIITFLLHLRLYVTSIAKTVVLNKGE